MLPFLSISIEKLLAGNVNLKISIYIFSNDFKAL